jgi:hypothetical protein
MLKPISLPEFMGTLEKYYGAPYDEFVSRVIVGYLRDFSTHYLGALLQTVVKRFSSRWGKNPDVAILEECSSEAWEIMSREDQPLALPDPGVTDDDRDEVARLMAEARNTPEGRMLLGALGAKE